MLRVHVRVLGLRVPLALYPEADLSVPDQLPVPHEEDAVLHDEAPEPDTHTHTGRRVRRRRTVPGSEAAALLCLPLAACQQLHVEVREQAADVVGVLLLPKRH